MKKKELIKDINLAFACKEDWNSMPNDLQEKRCENCSKKVYDFSNKTASELLQIMDGSKVSICGRFKKSQIKEMFIKYAASAFIATTGLSSPAAGQELFKADSAEHPVEHIHGENGYFIGEIVEEQPTPQSGYEAFYKKISEELKIPLSLTEKGKVLIQFTVGTDGNIRDAQVIKGFNELAEKEALRTFLKVDEKFKPARQRGKAVNAKLIFPILFDPETIKKKK